MIESLRTARLLLDLRRGTYRPPAEREALQAELLRRAVAHAEQHVPFYRRRWKEAGVRAEHVRSLKDLGRLPIITSAEVRAAAESGELNARVNDSQRLPTFSTSGASGRPMRVPRGPQEARLWRASGLHMQLAHGFRWWDTTVQFEAAAGRAHPLQALGIARTVWIPHEMPLDEKITHLVAARASFIMGNTTPLRSIARALAERGARPETTKTVFCMAEVLDDQSRSAIRAGFGVDPADVYGMTEIGFIAWQCERRAGLHVNGELVVVEILRGDVPAAPGEIGRVVVADLRGRTMPLLRYDTGDLATAASGPCGCDRTLPTIGPIEGRARHVVHEANGAMLTQRVVMNHLAATLAMGEYRLCRRSARGFVLEVTPRAFAAGSGGEQGVRDALARLLGDVDLSIESVDAMPPSLKTHAFVDESVASS